MSFTKIGIVDIAFQLPRFVIKQEEIAQGLDVDLDKLKIGLGLREFSVPDINEDCVSLALNALHLLMKRQNININEVGKIEVGSESNFDNSKSIKSYLMQFFPDNVEISGCDSVHACYGGTNALLNSLAYLTSNLCTKKYAIVVCTDICFYKDKAAVPTSGGGAVAILLGPNPILEIVPSSLRHCSFNTMDFCKPIMNYPYPVFKGKESIDNYIKAFDYLYTRNQIDFNYIVCHSPYPRLIEKVCDKYDISPSKYEKGLLTSRRNGNSYTASLYFGLISLLDQSKVKEGDTILMFSFGSGTISSLFCLQKTNVAVQSFNLLDRLEEREYIDFCIYKKILNNCHAPSTYSISNENTNSRTRFTISKIENGFRFYEN